jgi:hypothetical protein
MGSDEDFTGGETKREFLMGMNDLTRRKKN